jgi:tripartite-type tricarboxylate transporter receptor subunit TctC
MLPGLIVPLAALAMLSAPALSRAQEFPSRPVRMVVPFVVGTPDAIARTLAAQLTNQMGQNVIVDNRAGANGIIGTETVAKSAPDGYTLLLTSASFVVNPSIYRKLPFDPLKDFTPVSNVCILEAFILTVPPSLPAQTVKDLIALAKKPGTRLAYASPGVGNTIHIAGALFSMRAGIDMVHVPYKGGGPAVGALLGGEVQVMFANPPLALTLIQGGKLRALGYTGTKRLATLPGVPTMTEAGVQGMELDGGWFGLLGPAKMPPRVLGKLSRETRAALQNPQVRERLLALGLEPAPSTSAGYKALLEREVKAYAELVRITGIKAE